MTEHTSFCNKMDLIEHKCKKCSVIKQSGYILDINLNKHHGQKGILMEIKEYLKCKIFRSGESPCAGDVFLPSTVTLKDKAGYSFTLTHPRKAYAH